MRILLRKFRIASIFLALIIVLALATSVFAAINRVDRPALKDIYEDYFYMGCIYYSPTDIRNNAGVLYQAREMDGISEGARTDAGLKLKHFNSFTNANFMKPDNLWTNTYGDPRWIQGTLNVDDAVRLPKSLGIHLQGHTLLWHNQSPAWPAADNTWDYETARRMMEHYLKTVLTHFHNDDPLVQFDAIDVINEPMKNNPTNPTDWRSALRTGYNPEERTARWARAYAKGGNSWDYVYDAFMFSRRYTDWMLVYNDFNDMENEAMAIAVASMVKEFNETYAKSNERKLFDKDGKERKLVEAIGTQSHYDTRLNMDNFERNIKIYLDADVVVDLTEVDVTIPRATDKYRSATVGFITNQAELHELAKEQAIFYAKMFAMLKDVDKYKKGINRITLWGVNDNDWRSTGFPLPWYNTASATAFGTRINEPKEAYWAIVQPEAYLEEAGLPPNGIHATFNYGGNTYKARTWGGANSYTEVKISVPAGTRKIDFTKNNVTLSNGFTVTNITTNTPNGEVGGGKPCVVTVYAVGENPTAKDPTNPEVPLEIVKNTATFKLTFTWNEDSTKTNKAWRLAKSIENDKTYVVVSAASDMALANKSKGIQTGVVPQSLTRMPVIVSGDIITFHSHPQDAGGVTLPQENLKWVFTDRTSVPPGRYKHPEKYADQTGYSLQCFVHATAAYPQMMFRDTSQQINNQYEITTRGRDGAESPGIADKALAQAVWFNTGIDPDTGETQMFLYSEPEDQHYVLKEVLTGALNSSLSGNATANIIPNAAGGGFVALRSSNPFEDATAVKLYTYDIAPYDLIDATPSAVVEKLNGNKNNLTVTVIEDYDDGEIRVYEKTFSIDNNAAGTYQVGPYKVYVDTKGNTQIRACYIVK